MSIISLKQLDQVRNRHKNQKIVFCSGSFDLTHAGHALFFEDCKKYGDILAVAVGNDSTIKKLKGTDRPILNEHIRLYTVASLKAVDYCFLEPTRNNQYPLMVVDYLIKKLRPDIYIINEDAFDIPYRKKIVKKYKTKLVILNRWCPEEFENISTTGLIKKIAKGRYS